MKIIPGSAGARLANQISKDFCIEQVGAFVERYADQELRVGLEGDVCGEDVVIVQSTSTPTNDHLMELLLLVDAAKRAGARRITAVTPYFGYSRQDRLEGFGPLAANLVSVMMEAAGVDHLITLDLHHPQLAGCCKMSLRNLETTGLFANFLINRSDLKVVSPDRGGLIRACRLSNLLGVDLAVIDKSRQSPNHCEVHGMAGDVAGFHCIVVDDIVDTAETLCKASDFLMERGALSVEAFVTHAVLSSPSTHHLSHSSLGKVIVTNSIEQLDLGEKFHVISVAPLIGEVLLS